ncbi:hypothetical protein MRQ36_08490 [Micromonospora sp. R77]|uniref:hypothetical protein n=1 Tax=Micromonospora sp. R77 TaxID=2925836 RepID=UPI001F620AA4|nr:hypothetical protein [Micromonospora sp. R77]MCI4062602.1 hypothetical protein [Micromonospora sp. R77]
MKKLLSRTAGASALGVAVVLAGIPGVSGVAYAATTKCAYSGYDRACVTNYASTSTVEVCDNTNNGRSAYVWATLPTVGIGFNDTYGGSCTTKNYSVLVEDFKVCGDYTSNCSGRVYM